MHDPLDSRFEALDLAHVLADTEVLSRWVALNNAERDPWLRMAWAALAWLRGVPDAETIRTAAYDEGYREGYDDGYDQAEWDATPERVPVPVAGADVVKFDERRGQPPA